MTTDLNEGSPAGRLYGEALGNTLAVYLLNRYAARRYTPMAYRGGLPGYRLKRVLDYIRENLGNDLSLAELAAVVGMSPHYFAELFKKSTGRAPHQYVLLQRIERAKEGLADGEHSIIKVGLDTGFQNPGHFSRVFRRIVGTSPSQFKSDVPGPPTILRMISDYMARRVRVRFNWRVFDPPKPSGLASGNDRSGETIA